jgi:hypothetical protein
LSQVLERCAKAVFRGANRCLSQVLDRVAQAVARDAARCASQIFDHGTKTAARGASALSHQEKINSVVDSQQNRGSITGFICTVVGNSRGDVPSAS